MPLYWGTASMAIETGADIVLVAIERYGNEYCVNIGMNIKVKNSNINKSELTDLLRDEFAGLKWQIWEQKGIYPREELKDTRETVLNEMFGGKNTSVTIEDVLKGRFYPNK